MAIRNHRIRFMDNNVATDSSITITSPTDGNGTSFSDMLDTARYRYWTPEGEFEIDSTNNKIYFNDGADRTATLSSGSYTAAGLATEISTQMDAVAGTSGWIVSYQVAQNKFTFIPPTSITMQFSNQTNAAWDTIGFVSTSDAPYSSQFFADEVRIHTERIIHFDLNVATNITFLALIGPSEETFSLSETATVTIEGNNVDVWTSPAFTHTATIDDLMALAFLDEVSDNTVYRYWRVRINDRLNPNGADAIKLSYIYLGDHIELTRNVGNGFIKQWVDPSKSSQSESGVEYFNTRTRYLRFSSMGINYLEEAERLDLEQLFYNSGKFTPIFVSLDPTLKCSTNYTDMTRYVRFEGDPTFNHVRYNYYNIGFSLKEVL